MHKIYLHGEINEEMALRFSQELSVLEANKKVDEVIIELSSEGGIAYDALTIAGRMRSSNLGIHVRAYGLVASAAVIILAYGCYRTMTEESWVMVHEDSGDATGSVSELEAKVAHARRMEIQWYKLMANSTHISAEKWARLHKATTYLSAEESLKLGLIDEIV